MAAVLLAVAAVATAWSSYQASRWTGEQAKAFATASASRVESTRSSNLANAQTQIDVAVFIQWVDARLQGEADLVCVLRGTVPRRVQARLPSMAPNRPVRGSSAPPSPFAMDEYQLAATQEADKLSATAEASAELARTYIQRATNYVLGVVLFATSLFFAGISTKLNSTRLRGIILGVGCVIFVLAASWIATFPISLSI